MKCKYYKECKLYSKDSKTCNEDGGMYGNYNKPAGCYILMEEKK